MNEITSEIRKNLLERGADLAAVKTTHCVRHRLILNKGIISTVSTDSSYKVEIKLKKDGLSSKKEYTVGEDFRVKDLTDDILAGLNDSESVFTAEPEKSGIDINEVFDTADIGMMAEAVIKLNKDCSECGLTIPRATLTRTETHTVFENEVNTVINIAQSGYMLSYSANKTCSSQTLTPLRVSKRFASLAQFPCFPKDSIQVEFADLGFNKRKHSAFNGDLIIAPSCLYPMTLDFLFSELFEDAIATGSSKWADKHGTKVMPNYFTASMDPFHESAVWGERIRSDGTLSKPYTLIENGVLKNFIVTPEGVASLSLTPCGNDGDNLVMPNGDKPLAEMISGIEHGIILVSFAGGGDGGLFSGTSPDAYLIENGQITAFLDNPEISGDWNEIYSSHSIEFSQERESDGEYLLPYMHIKNMNL